jgi:Protein of unknown function (DUF2806)
MSGEESPASSPTGSDLIEVAVGAITDIHRIPSPIRGNVFKSIGRLIGAATDVPVAALEAKAAEIRAHGEARASLIKVTGQKISLGIAPPTELSTLALNGIAGKLLREQENVQKILTKSIQHVADKSHDVKEEPPEIADDWLNAFEREASQKSSVEMQDLFAKILAGEIVRPSSFSIMSLRTIGQMDQKVADLFQTVASLHCEIRSGADGNYGSSACVISLDRDPHQNGMQEFKLGFNELNLLAEFGLLAPRYDARADYQGCTASNNSVLGTFFYANQHWGLSPLTPRDYRIPLWMNGLRLSKVGSELVRIVPVEANEMYTKQLDNFLRSQGYTRVPVQVATNT